MPHDPGWPLPLQVYVVAHFLLVLWTYHDVFESKAVGARDGTGRGGSDGEPSKGA